MAEPAARPKPTALADARVKGAVIREFLVWYESVHGRGYVERVCARLEPDELAKLSPERMGLGMLPTGWYSSAIVHAVLDGVTDPHNLGACLRSAAAAGATAVVVPKDRSAPLNAAARKAAAGGAEAVPLVRVTNLARAMEQLRRDGVWIVGLAGEAEQSLYQRELTGPLALVLGAEGEGMRRLTREHCDFLVRIPIDAAMESLNVSVAAGICLFEARRQRGPAA